MTSPKGAAANLASADEIDAGEALALDFEADDDECFCLWELLRWMNQRHPMSIDVEVFAVR